MTEKHEPGTILAFTNTNVGDRQYPSAEVEVVSGPDTAGSYKVRYTHRRNPGDEDWYAYRGELHAQT